MDEEAMSESTGRQPGPDPELTNLVEKTAGVQPWRRVFHATNGIVLVLVLTLLPIEDWVIWIVLGIALAISVLVDAVRLYDPEVNRRFFRLFMALASPREARELASSTWYVLGVLLTLVLFPRPYALAGILVLALADPTASVIGRIWGRIPFLAGSLRGTLAFASVAFLVLIFFVPWWAALITALFTALMEASPLDLDDNLLVPITVAGLLFLLGP
jgi:dolichol kinase